MTQDAAKWLEWFKYTEPEENELPGEWEEKCSELQRMMLLRCFRQVSLSLSLSKAHIAIS
jgi:dynein heavy chain